MGQQALPSYQKYAYWALLLVSIAAWFNIGYHHPDEHFQILEFANYKMGNIQGADLPWEFEAQIRPTLQPTLFWLGFQVFDTLCIDQPFILVYIYRLLSTIWMWWVVLLLIKQVFKNDETRWWAVGFMMLTWFIPYIHTRFSSECLGAAFLLYGIYHWLKAQDVTRNAFLRYVLVGFCLGLAFYLRFQIAFSIIGLVLWQVFIQKRWQPLWPVFIGGVIGVLLNVLVDAWFYGNWVIAPYNYYTANIVEDVASTFGVQPWYDYFVQFIIKVVPPLSLVFLFLYAVGTWRKPTSIWQFVLIPFLLGHILVPHKELRFIFPIAIPFLMVALDGFLWLYQQYVHKKWFKTVLSVCLVINGLLLVFRTFTPTREDTKYFRQIYKIHQQHPDYPLYCLMLAPYGQVNIHHIYLPKKMNMHVFTTPDALLKHLNNTNDTVFLLYQKGVHQLENLPVQWEGENVYSHLPKVILKNNINNWQARSNINSLWLYHKHH